MPVNRAKFHFDNTYAGMDMLYGPYVLYQIGDLSCEAGYQTFEHEQAVYEITYVLSGTGAFYVGQHRTIAEASAVESPIRQETIGFPAHFFARAHNFKPPGRACQPEADSPMRT